MELCLHFIIQSPFFEGGESSAFPTPTDMIGVADTSSFIQDSWAMIIMAAEGVVILILLLVLLVVVVWACRIKKAKIKSVALIRKADEDDYTLPPGTSAE